MKNYILSVLFLHLIIPGMATLAVQSPVLLFLSKQDQVDTLGYNIVNELPMLVYNEIMSGRVPLWDSPEKTIQIKPSSLKRLEVSSGDDFIRARQLFIYELWDLDKRKGDLKTVGFYFSSRTTKGEDVSYGFVEYEPLDSLFRVSYIPSNANGNCNISFYEVLKSKYYFFNVVQVGEKKITNIKEALALKDEVKLIVNQRTVPPDYDCKMVEYQIEHNEKDSSETAAKSERLLKSLQLFLNENIEVFYNLGGDKILNFIQAQTVTVSSVEIHENWRKILDRTETELISFRIYAEKEALDILPRADIHEFDLLVDFMTLPDFLNEKEFYFRITKINNQEIVDAQSAAYLKGLKTWKWNQLTEFVRYE